MLFRSQAFDVVTVPSHVEPMGNATIEAMAAGRPVVGSEVGGIPESVLNNETGLLVPPASPRDLADAVEQLVRSPELRDTLGSAGRRRATEVFGMARHGADLQRRYDQLCAA